MSDDPSYGLRCVACDDYLEKSNDLCNTDCFDTQACLSEYFLLRQAGIYFVLERDAKVFPNREDNAITKMHRNKTLLHCAVQINDIEITKSLLQENADVEARSNDLTPLHIAAQLGNTEIAKVLLDHGADTNSVCASSLGTLLQIAVMKDNEVLVEMLLRNGTNMSPNMKDESTLLHLAAESSSFKVVKLLLNNSVDIDVCDEDTKKIVYFAAERYELELIELVLEVHLAQKKNRECFYSAIHGSMGEMHSKIHDSLRRYGFGVKSKDVIDRSMLHAAISQGCLRIVEYFLSLSTNFDAETEGVNDRTPLHTAIMFKQIEIVKLLIKNKANVNAKARDGRSSLRYAIKCGLRVDYYGMGVNCTMPIIMSCPERDDDTRIRDIATIILDRGADVNAHAKDGTTALHVAAKRGYQKVVELLLEYNANVNSIDKSKETPLHFSVRNRNEKIIEILLDAGAMVNAKRTDGATALHVAIEMGHAEAVKIFMKNGADIAGRKKDGWGSLHIAAANGNPEIFEILLNAFEEVDCRDRCGRTALHIATKHGNPQIVQLLLDHDSDINLCSDIGKTPFDYAIDGVAIAQDDGPWFVRPDEYFDDDDEVCLTCPIVGGDDVGEEDEENDFYNCNKSDDRFEEIFEMLRQHIIKMIAMNSWVSDINVQAIHIFRDDKNFHVQCKREIECMRQNKIGVSNVSFYDVLTQGMNRLTLYARNKDIVDALETGDHNDMFDLYSGMLNCRFKNGQKRAGLLDSSLKSLRFLTGHPLSDLSIIKILNYLSNKDLKNLTKAGPRDESDSSTQT